MLHIIPHIKKEAAMTRSDRSIIEIPGSPQEGEYQIGGGSSYMTPQPPVESFFEHSFNQGETIQSPSLEKDEEYLRKNITRFPELGERRFGGIEAVGERLQGTGMSEHGELGSNPTQQGKPWETNHANGGRGIEIQVPSQ